VRYWPLKSLISKITNPFSDYENAKDILNKGEKSTVNTKYKPKIKLGIAIFTLIVYISKML